MKLIITEEQYRLLIEGEGRLLPVPEDMWNQDGGITKIYSLFEKTRDTKNWVGIKVVGDLSLTYEDDKHLKDFCEYLVEVTGDFDMANRKRFEFPLLVKVDGDVNIANSDIDFPKLRYVGGDFRGRGSDTEELPELEYVGGSLSLRETFIQDLPKLKYVGDVLNIMDSSLSKKTTEEELRSKINVEGNIWL